MCAASAHMPAIEVIELHFFAKILWLLLPQLSKFDIGLKTNLYLNQPLGGGLKPESPDFIGRPLEPDTGNTGVGIRDC